MSWKVSARANGIKKGCRKVNFHSSGPLAVYADKPSEADCVALATAWVYMNMKETKSAKAIATYWTQNGEMETWEPFNKDHNIKYKIV